MKATLTCAGLTLPGEPGPAFFGHSLAMGDGERLFGSGGVSGVGSGIAAEYLSVIHGLEFARSHGVTEVVVRSASNPLYMQVIGRWSIRQPEVVALNLQVKTAGRNFRKSALRIISPAEAEETYQLAIAHFVEKVEQGNRQRATEIQDAAVLEIGEGLWDVSGSKGEVHHVDLGGRVKEGTCSCMAYSIANACRPVRDRGMRIRCKHIEKVRQMAETLEVASPRF